MISCDQSHIMQKDLEKSIYFWKAKGTMPGYEITDWGAVVSV